MHGPNCFSLRTLLTAEGLCVMKSMLALLATHVRGHQQKQLLHKQQKANIMLLTLLTEGLCVMKSVLPVHTAIDGCPSANSDTDTLTTPQLVAALRSCYTRATRATRAVTA
jgi:hypothetical protein